MEKEVKIADLAKLWGISVNTTWKRVHKGGLRTVKKVIEGREITFVIIDDADLNINRVHEGVIIPDYEDSLRDDKGYEVQKSDPIDKIMEYSKSINEQIMNLNEVYNQRVNTLNEEIITYKSKNLLLEDKASREGLYLNEINQLKKDNESYKMKFTILLTFTVSLVILLGLYMGLKLFF